MYQKFRLVPTLINKKAPDPNSKNTMLFTLSLCATLRLLAFPLHLEAKASRDAYVIYAHQSRVREALTRNPIGPLFGANFIAPGFATLAHPGLGAKRNLDAGQVSTALAQLPACDASCIRANMHFTLLCHHAD